jgi:hypothetical protein
MALTDPPQPRYSLSDTEDLRLTREEFPGWDIFRGLHYIWHARLRDADPPLKIRAEELHILRHRIGLAIRHRARRAAQPPP